MKFRRDPQQLQERIGHSFRNPDLLVEALCHRSYANEFKHGTLPHNERLEFLGDSVVGFITAQALVRRYPEAAEGWLTQVRAALVMTDSLARFARHLGLADYALLGKGEERSQGRIKEKLNANLFEAVIGAVYLDSGVRACERIMKPLIMARLAEQEPQGMVGDYKSRLQEATMQRWGRLPRYRLERSDGPEHQKVFHMSVWLGEDRMGRGEGKSKKEAQQMAAKDALALIGTDPEHSGKGPAPATQ